MLFLFLFLCLFAISWAALTAYGGSQARGLIGAVATGLRRILNPLGKAGDQTHILMDTSWVCFRSTTVGTLGSNLTLKCYLS